LSSHLGRALSLALSVLHHELASIQRELLTRLKNTSGIFFVRVLDIGEASRHAGVVILGDVDIGNASMGLKELGQVARASVVLEATDVERNGVFVALARHGCL